MKSIFSVVLVLTILGANQAEALLKCTDSAGALVLEAEKLEKPTASGETVLARFKRAGRPDLVKAVHPLSSKGRLSFVDYLFQYDDGRVLTLDLIQPLDSSGSQKTNFASAPLRVRYIEIVKKEVAPGWWTDVNEERTEELRVNCTLSPEVAYVDPCTDKSSDEIEELLLLGAGLKSSDLVEQALSCGVDLDAVNGRGCTALMLASEVERFDCGDESSLPHGLRFVDSRYIFKLLGNAGADLDMVENEKGQSVIHKLVTNRQEKLLEEFVSLDGNPDVQDRSGSTALMLAADQANSKAVRILVKGNADISVTDAAGKTAYDRGVRLKDEVRELLLDAAVTLDIQGKEDGSCVPIQLEIPATKRVRLNLVASKSQMFMLNIPAADVSIMADAGGTVSKTFSMSTPGTYPFTCGVHGGNETQGKLIVK